MLRAYYWCSRCRQGQFPADIARDIQNTEFSPGVRRMLALVGSHGHLEIAVREGSAAARLGLQGGERVILRFGSQ